MVKIILEYNSETNEILHGGFIENGESFIVEGVCNGCGKCCKDRCSDGYLTCEIKDGKEFYRCSLFNTRYMPAACIMWPTCKEDLDTNPWCTLKYKKVE